MEFEYLYYSNNVSLDYYNVDYLYCNITYNKCKLCLSIIDKLFNLVNLENYFLYDYFICIL